MDYNTFRHFADSWGLIYLFVLMVGVWIFVFRPGAKEAARNAAEIPFKADAPLKEGDDNVR
ncbi:MAG: cbb3-type cytochrome oxidase subunit 3 [Flavobacteriaceae bacterium]